MKLPPSDPIERMNLSHMLVCQGILEGKVFDRVEGLRAVIGATASPEQWRGAPGFEKHYYVTDGGRVVSVRTGRDLTGTPIKGYINVRLTNGRGTERLRPIHQLVCEAFHGQCPAEKEMVGHLDGDKLNNRASNLAWITRSENTLHSIEHGTFASAGGPPRHSMPGELHPMAKLTEKDVREIRARLAAGETRRPIAESYGVSLACISAIKNGKAWASDQAATRLDPPGFDQAQGGGR